MFVLLDWLGINKVSSKLTAENKTIMTRIQQGDFEHAFDNLGEDTPVQFTLKDAIEYMQRHSCLYGGETEEEFKIWNQSIEPLLPSNHFEATTIKVFNMDCVNLCFQLINETKETPLLLNLCNRNANSVCGKYYLPFCGTQEEYIERRSIVYRMALDPKLNPHLPRNSNPRYHVPNFGVVYTPKVPILRDSSYKFVKEPFFVDIVACGAPDLRKVSKMVLFLKRRENERANYFNRDELDEETWGRHMERKISAILLSARVTNHKHLVLGALGSGAFENDPRKVAALFHKLLTQDERFKNQFHTVYFAVLGEPNYSIFKDILET